MSIFLRSWSFALACLVVASAVQAASIKDTVYSVYYYGNGYTHYATPIFSAFVNGRLDVGEGQLIVLKYENDTFYLCDSNTVPVCLEAFAVDLKA